MLMDLFVRFQLHVFTLFVLLVIYVIMRTRSKIDSMGKRILRTATVLAFTGVLMEPVSWIFDGKSFAGAKVIEYGSNLLLFIIASMIASLMIGYLKHKVQHKRIVLWKQLLLFPPTLFTVFILGVNVFYPLYFTVDDQNQYSSSSYLWIHYVVLGGTYLYVLYFLIRHRHQITRISFMTYAFFFLLPMIGMLIQMYEVQIFLAWNSIALSILVIYIFFETTSGDRDFLTQLFSRLSYETYVENLIDRKKPFAVAYFDLNQFKLINDHYGHLTGDDVLILFGKYLVKTFDPNRMISRIGGDEYIVIIEDEVDIAQRIKELDATIKQSENKVFNRMTFSYGYERHRDPMTLDELYAEVDRKMYEYKRNRPN